MLLNEKGRAGRNPDEAVAWLRRAADRRDPIAQRGLAIALREGRGVARDAGSSAEFLRASAEQGCLLAQCDLGICYLRGTGVASRRSARCT